MDWDAAEFFRAQARKCIGKADEVADLRLKGHWVDVGTTWWILADEAERRSPASAAMAADVRAAQFGEAVVADSAGGA